MSKIALSQEQKDLFSYIDSIMPEDGHLVYDLRDKKQYQFARMMHELQGKNPQDFPGLYRMLDDIRARQQKNGYQPKFKAVEEDEESWQTSIDIAGVGTVASPAVAGSNGVGTVVGGFTQMTLSLFVQNTANQSILASGYASMFAPNTTLGVETVDSSAQAPAPSMTAYLNYTYQPAGGEEASVAETGTSGVVTRDSPRGTVEDPVVTQPARNCTNPVNPNAINIGLGRNWGDQGNQFDYVWNEQNKSNPQGRIPFVGNVHFGKAIAPLNPGVNFNLYIVVVDSTNGGTTPPLTVTDMTNVYNNFTIDPNDNTNLKWNLPSGVSNLNTGNPIVFTNISWPSNMESYFNCNIQVTFQDGTLGFANVISSPSPNNDPLDGTTYIMPIEFIWHCLGKGTKILCADKTTRVIEDFERGHEIIKDASGNKGTVHSTNLGIHKGPVLKLTTDQGHTLIISHNHPVMVSASDAKRAHELAVGDKVITVDGTAKITQINELDYRDLMGNLLIDEHLPKQIGTFFANGILVGDVAAQKKLTRKRAADKEWVKQAVGKYWHQDVESHFAGK